MFKYNIRGENIEVTNAISGLRREENRQIGALF